MTEHVGQDALHFVTNLTFFDDQIEDITEVTAGIDVDGHRPGGRWSREAHINERSLLWDVLNHVAYYGLDENIRATADERERLLELVLYDPKDTESYGTVYTITYKESSL
ncbi:hypothetical protein PBI_CHE12_95 [Mycobacterium phage Che12]|uniref:Uncharacterized protein n=1 Tax=Mycobacterium phage Che12 TaxID=2911435 RepID=Q1A0C2_9CAUD|nr:gp95 [Mycobacterium phage Che12]ABE67414.1 hypothetical protein PBI_CHE12_95 [Mycobacterium phage Che12]